MDAVQQTGQAITATRHQGHIGAAGRSPVNGRQTGRIVSGKTQVAGQRRLVHLHPMPHGRQTFDTAPKCRLVPHCARGRINIDVFAHKLGSDSN